MQSDFAGCGYCCCCFRAAAACCFRSYTGHFDPRARQAAHLPQTHLLAYRDTPQAAYGTPSPYGGLRPGMYSAYNGPYGGYAPPPQAGVGYAQPPSGGYPGAYASSAPGGLLPLPMQGAPIGYSGYSLPARGPAAPYGGGREYGVPHGAPQYFRK
jgi:hypothetical protein